MFFADSRELCLALQPPQRESGTARRQCELLGISRSTPYYERKGSDAESVRLKEEILSRIDSGQGSQFTRMEYKTLFRSLSIRQSMDGKSRWADNIMIERWFRSLKTEMVYINEFRSPKELRQVIRQYICDYNTLRPHEAIGLRDAGGSFSLLLRGG